VAFDPPTFNLLCNVWHQVPDPPALPAGAPNIANLPCNLRILKTADVITTQGSQPTAFIAVPKGTDLRVLVGWRSLRAPGGTTPIIECPAGTGRIYQIFAIDDVAKGFPNEYRFALVTQVECIGGPPLP